MTENNVVEFCQWLMNEKGIEAGNLSDYINNNEDEVLKLAEEFKKPKFKVGGKIEAAAEMFRCGGKTKKKIKKDQYGGSVYNREQGRKNKKDAGIYYDTPMSEFSTRGSQNQASKIAKAKAVKGFENSNFIDPSDFDRRTYRQRKRDARNFNMTRRQRKAYALLDDSYTPTINPGPTDIYDPEKVESINKVRIPIIMDYLTPINNDYKIDTHIDWPDIPFEITPIKPQDPIPPIKHQDPIPPRIKAGWDQFANEIIAKHANENLYRSTSSNLGMQKHYENEYDKYLKDPDNYVYSPIDAKYAAELQRQIMAKKSRLKYSMPLKGRDYYDPNEHYVNFGDKKQSVPGKSNWGKASDNIAHAITGTIATTAALPEYFFSLAPFLENGGKINKCQKGRSMTSYRPITDREIYEGGNLYDDGEELYRQDPSGYYYRNVIGADTTSQYRPNFGETYDIMARPGYRIGEYNTINGESRRMSATEIDSIIKIITNKLEGIKNKNK